MLILLQFIRRNKEGVMDKTVGIISLGCSKNTVDTELMLGIFVDLGYEIVNQPSKANVLAVNTCGFIQSAKEESIDTIFELAKYKKKDRGICETLIVTGCLSQRYPDELMAEVPEVDILLGVNQYDRLPELLGQKHLNPIQSTEPSLDFLEGNRVLTTPSHTAYIRISDGCDNRCSFCAIPLIRGPYRSRSSVDILKEISALSNKGVKEHILIAQDTSRYGIETSFAYNLSKLIKKAAQIPAVKWLRLLYSYPDQVNLELLDTLANTPKVCPYLDLPLQHIDDQLLATMNRRGRSKDIQYILSQAKLRNLAIRTTFIVGFPGESDEKFKALLSFIKDQEFDHLGAFAFSPEEGTKAALLDNQVPETLKQERLHELLTLQAQISLKKKRRRIGQRIKVLIDRQFAKNHYIARSQFEAPDVDGHINIFSQKNLNPGDFLTITITEASTYDLTGEVYEST